MERKNTSGFSYVSLSVRIASYSLRYLSNTYGKVMMRIRVTYTQVKEKASVRKLSHHSYMVLVDISGDIVITMKTVTL